LHAAADGPLARVRLPGGLLTGPQLTVIRELAETWGDGHAELTSRANLQLRALRTAPAEDLAARLWAAGLLPSQTHELVRNIAASPLSGAAVRALVRDTDAALCADPELAELPGRFLFAVDDGSGDVAPAADVAAIATARSGNEFAIVLAGVDMGLRVGSDRVVEALLAAAHAFLGEHADSDDRPAWRLRELDNDGQTRVAARTAGALGLEFGSGVPAAATRVGAVAREPTGIVAQADHRVAVGALVRLGRLDRVQMKVLEEAELLVVTPWRGVVVPGLAPEVAESWLRALAEAGFEVTAGSRWSGVTACAGRPGCANSLADVRHDAAAVVLSDVGAAGAGGPGAGVAGRLPVHWVGCARGCGSPPGAHVRVEATPSGYAVTRAGDLDCRAGSAPCDMDAPDSERLGKLVDVARRG
jgi:precorrin-3B synthase